MNTEIESSSGNNSFLLFVLKFFNILFNYKWIIFWGTFIPSVLVVTFCLLAKDTYVSRAVVIPPAGGGASPLASMLGDMSGMAGLLNLDLAGNSDINLTLEIAQSDVFKRKLIKKFDLYEHYKFDPELVKIESVIRRLNNHLGISETKQDNIYILFEDEEPPLCSAVVAYSFHFIDSMYLSIKNKQLVKQQKFINNKEIETRNLLSEALDTLIQFENTNKIYLPETQMELLVGNLVDLEKKKRILDDELEYIRKTESIQSEMYKKMRIKRNILKRQLDSLDSGNLDNEKILTSVKNTPGLIKKYKELFMEVKIQQELLKFFVKTNEELKFKASTDYTQLQLLSPGFVPTKKFGPPKTAICVVIFTIALIFSIMLVLILNYFREHRTANTELYQSWLELKPKLRNFYKI